MAAGRSYSVFGKCQTSMRRTGPKQQLEGPVNLRELFRDLCLSVFLSRQCVLYEYVLPGLSVSLM